MEEKIIKEKLFNLKLNEIDDSNPTYWIQRVIGGWVYIYLDINKTPKTPTTSVFVPEIINNEIINNDDFHRDWIIDYSDKNNNRKSKHVYFNNKTHKDNWYAKWEGYGNKIIGEHKANNLGILIE